jgi:hypothetical protein
MDASSAAYLSATAVLVLAELRALITKDNDDTITHKVKASTPLHAAMVSLLTWGLYHFTLEDEIGNPGAAAGVAVAVAGGLLGFWVSRRRG